MHGTYCNDINSAVFHIHIFWSPWKTSDFVVVKSPVLTTSHSLPQWPESTHRELHLPSTDRSSLSSYEDDIDQWCWHCAYKRQEVKKCYIYSDPFRTFCKNWHPNYCFYFTKCDIHYTVVHSLLLCVQCAVFSK